MLGINYYEKKGSEPCNQTEKERQVQLDTKFIKEAASYVNPYCAGKEMNLSLNYFVQILSLSCYYYPYISTNSRAM